MQMGKMALWSKLNLAFHSTVVPVTLKIGECQQI